MPTEVKIFRPVRIKLEESLLFLFENKSASSKVINYTFKNNKKWGARDRRIFAETFYEIVRNIGQYLNDLGLDSIENLTQEKIAKVIDLHLEQKKIEMPMLRELRASVSKDLYEVLQNSLDKKEVVDFLNESNKEAPVFIRRNRLKTDTEKDFLNSLNQEGIEVIHIQSDCYKLKERKNVFQSQSFKKGYFEIQDGASQEVAQSMELEKGMRVADSCAGAGGKSLHIASLLNNSGKVISMDVEEKRLLELKKRAKRAGVQNIEIKDISSTKVIKRMQKKFDRVLLDVPCTGTGTYRRKPEAKIFFTKAELARLTAIQKEILTLHSQLVKPGGLLIYSTCSILPAENMEQVNWFLNNNKNFKLVMEKTNQVGQNNFDGFFMAKILRED